MRHIQNKLVILIIALSLLPTLAIGFFAYSVSARALQEKLNRSSLSTLEQINRNVEVKYQKAAKYMDQFFAGDKISKFMDDLDLVNKSVESYESAQEIDKLFESAFFKDGDIDSVILLTNKEYGYVYKGYVPEWQQLKENEWFKTIVKGNGESVWAGNVPNPNTISSSSRAFLVGRVVRDISYKKDFESKGVFILVLNNNIFLDIYQNLVETPYAATVITDAEGKVISQNKEGYFTDLNRYSFSSRILDESKGYFREKMGNEEMMITFYTSPVTGWKVVQAIPYFYFIEEIRSIRWMTLALSGICLLVILSVSMVSARTLSKPIKQLMLAMRRVGEKDFDVTVPVNTKDEIGMICSGFNTMVGDLKTLFQAVVEEERQKRKAQIKSLQYQVNPHFLYNTLSSIRFTASLQKADNVAEMIMVLSRLLRNTINKADMLIPISEEIGNLKDYIYIQQIRYKNRIQVEYDIDEAIQKVKVPGMLLQPLVENSISHGLSERLNQEEGTALIKVKAYEKADKICFEVWDNGVGMTKEQIDNVFESKYQLEEIPRVHVGIKNIHDRIRYQYGADYGIRIQSVPGEFSLMEISLPELGGAVNG